MKSNSGFIFLINYRLVGFGFLIQLVPLDTNLLQGPVVSSDRVSVISPSSSSPDLTKSIAAQLSTLHGSPASSQLLFIDQSFHFCLALLSCAAFNYQGGLYVPGQLQ